MVYLADIVASGADRVVYACEDSEVVLQRAVTEYEDWATARARRLDPDAPHVSWLPAGASAAARRAKQLRRMGPESAFVLGQVTVDARAGFRIEFRCVDDVAELDDDARRALVAA
jgi:hypothetical protein